MTALGYDGDSTSTSIIDQDFLDRILTENAALKKRNTGLETENADQQQEIVELKAENDVLKKPQQDTESIVSYVRLFKFQSTALGHSFFLLLPLCGVVVPLSSLELTDWSFAVPHYNADVFWRVWGALCAGVRRLSRLRGICGWWSRSGWGTITS